MRNDSLGDRMKGYENVNRTYLPRRMPLIIRIDGKAFHSLTNGFVKPFDDVLIKSMQDTAVYLCDNIEGCRFAYTQSDEISLLISDYDTIDTQPWFGKNLQKIVSVSASMATVAFNKAFITNYRNAVADNPNLYFHTSHSKRIGIAMFDSRAFVLPKEEVCNYFIWRQQDATRNSIQMVGHAYFSNKELHQKSCNAIQDMLMTQHGTNWNDYPTHQKRGSCIVKKQYNKDGIQRSKWVVDFNIPIFTQDRNYIDRYVLKENVLYNYVVSKSIEKEV